MLLGLGGIVPEYFHVEGARRLLPGEAADDGLGRALQRMQARPGTQQFLRVVPLKQPAHRRGVRLAPEIAEPRQQPPRLVRPFRLGEILAHQRQRVQVVQDQAPSLQTDQALAKVHQFRQP